MPPMPKDRPGGSADPGRVVAARGRVGQFHPAPAAWSCSLMAAGAADRVRATNMWLERCASMGLGRCCSICSHPPRRNKTDSPVTSGSTLACSQNDSGRPQIGCTIVEPELRLGYFGASTGGGAALVADAHSENTH